MVCVMLQLKHLRFLSEKVMKTAVQNQEDISKVDSWTSPYKDYIGILGHDVDILDNTLFSSSLTQFLYSPTGAKYRTGFKFSEDLKCGNSSPEILLSEITYTHRQVQVMLFYAL